MKVSFDTRDVFDSKTDGIVIFAFENADVFDQARIAPILKIARERKEFEGKPKQIYVDRQAEMPRFTVVVGLGKKENLSVDIVRVGSGIGAETLRNLGAKSVTLQLPADIDAETAGQAAAEGVLLRTYQFLKYKTKLDDFKELQSITIVGNANARQGVERGVIIAESCNYVRDLQNTPSIDMTPQVVAEAAAKLAKEEKLRCTILDKRQLIKQGFGGVLSVGKGSAHDPRFVTVEYAPKGAKKTIALVGKGITFDTGGISIKPSKGMSDMKFDMSGAANVLGIVRNASKMKLPVRIIGILCLAENMPDGNSYKPGDIVKTKSGKTIEIDNTDAEGRVVLSDGLYVASTYKPEFIIDMATLTGACVVTLGDIAAGLMGNNQQVVDKVLNASEISGEKVWQLPLWEDYAEDIKSQIADMKNVGMPGMAGTISAAMLLKEFVADTPWVHLDIAGVAWAQGRERYFTPYGGTAFGVRLVTQILRDQ